MPEKISAALPGLQKPAEILRIFYFWRKKLDLQPSLRCNVRAEVKQMNIKQASEQSGVSAPNIRFYEKEGLLTPARRQGNDYRDYTAGDVRTLKLIRMLRMLDVPLPTIKAVLRRANSPCSRRCKPSRPCSGAAGRASGGSHAVLCRPCPAAAAGRNAGCGCLPDPDGKACRTGCVLLWLAAGLPHAGTGAAPEAFFLYSGGQHQHSAGVHSGPADLRKGQRDAVQP